MGIKTLLAQNNVITIQPAIWIQLRALEQLDLRPITRRYSKNIAENLLSGKACKLEQNLSKFETRTAGMCYVMRSWVFGCHILKCIQLKV